MVAVAAAAKAKQAKRDGSRSPDTRHRRGDKGNPDRMRDRYNEREDRKAARRERGEPAKLEEATSIEEALSAEYEAGERAGRAAGNSTGAGATNAGGDNAGAGRTMKLPTSSGVPGVSAPLVVATALITADELVTLKRFPAPSRLLIAWGFFGVLGLARGQAEAPAAALAWGIVVAMFYAKASPTKPPALRALDAIGDFIAGGNKTGAAANAAGAFNSAGSRQPAGGRSPAPTPGTPKPYDPRRLG